MWYSEALFLFTCDLVKRYSDSTMAHSPILPHALGTTSPVNVLLSGRCAVGRWSVGLCPVRDLVFVVCVCLTRFFLSRYSGLTTVRLLILPHALGTTRSV